MNTKKKHTALVVLVVISLLTLLVFFVPQKTIISKLLGLKHTFSGLHKHFSHTAGDPLIGFVSTLTGNENKKVTLSSNLHGKMLGSLFGQAEGSKIIVDTSLDSEYLLSHTNTETSTHQRDGSLEQIKQGVVEHSVLGNGHVEYLQTGTGTFIYLHQLDLVQPVGEYTQLLLRNALLKNYKQVWVKSDEPIHSLAHFIKQSKKSVRILELTPEERYIELEGGGIGFIGEENTQKETLSGSLVFSSVNLTGSLHRIANTNTYTLNLKHGGSYPGTFSGTITIDSSESAQLSGVTLRNDGIELTMQTTIGIKKTGTQKQPSLPEEALSRTVIKKNLLGLE